MPTSKNASTLTPPELPAAELPPLQTPEPPSPLRQLSERLRAERSPPADDAAAAAPPSDEKPTSFDALLARSGLTPEEFYALEVPAKKAGAPGHALGKLKDLAAEQEDFTLRSLRLDEDRRRFELDRVQGERELRSVLETLPEAALKPEALKKVREAQQARHAQEVARTLEEVPEWRDVAVRNQELKGLTDYLQSKGLPETFLLQNFNHQTVKFLRDRWQAEERFAKALAAIEERPAQNTPARSKAGTPARKAAQNGGAPTTRHDQQVSAFMDQIRQAANTRQ